ncbi:MAG: hypothetical protein MUC39_05320 [Candidatus Omnitrophica bacterium]|jgi:hypothetical protein|nr:hypothetical protein [Candidatus Omnitrophota bacterium]
MINLDFSAAVALYAGCVLIILLIFWLADKKQKESNHSLDDKFIWFCSICSYTYINTKEEVISTCPRCGSYNKRN